MGDVREGGERFEERDKAVFSPIFPVAGGVLRDEDELVRLAEGGRLLHEFLHGIGDVFSPDLRDQAVGAVVETAVGDLEILEMRHGGDKAVGPRAVPRSDGVDPLSLAVGAFERGKELRVVLDAEENICLGERGKEFADEFLGKTARDDDLLEVPLPVPVSLEYGGEGFLPRAVEEGAGVDDEDLRS